jgi:uncharacterized membrane protein
MKKLSSFLSTCLVGGLLIVVPLWITAVLISSVIAALRGVLHPFGGWLIEGSEYPDLVAFLILVLLCFGAGVFTQTSLARSIGSALDGGILVSIPGYRLVQSLLYRLTGEKHGDTWAVALVQFDDALTPGFVVEELQDGHYTVYVPSAPTPAAGTVYVMEARRVHIVDVPFPHALRCVAQWGVGSSALLAALNAQKASATGGGSS